MILQLIRETKGTQDETKLQFPQERRKIDCARKYFKALHLDYQHITEHTSAWWLYDDVQQPSLGVYAFPIRDGRIQQTNRPDMYRVGSSVSRTSFLSGGLKR